MRSANVHRCQDLVEKKRQFPETETITPKRDLAGPFIGVRVGVGGILIRHIQYALKNIR